MAHKERIIKTVRFLSEEVFPRTPANTAKTVEFIVKTFTDAGLDVTHNIHEEAFETYPFTNIYALKKGKTNRRIIVAAHYDTVPQSPGADDNASAVAVLIELAYLLKEVSHLNCDVELVSYDAEETGYRGSRYHAGKLKSQNVDVVCMLCMDLVGYYSDEENSQNYPMAELSAIYGTKGDFLGIIGKSEDAQLVADAQNVFQKTTTLRVESMVAPKDMEGSLSFTLSDHSSFWDVGYSALFFTDTAFYRNKNYHKETDTWDTLDYDRLSQVPIGLYHVILAMDATL